MKIVIIDGHPDPDRARLIHALADEYAAGAEESCYEVRRFDVADIDFPLLRSAKAFKDELPPSAIAEVQDACVWSDHLVLLYPLWLGTMPALLKGFLEQTFRPDFAFDNGARGWPQALLDGRTARVVDADIRLPLDIRCAQPQEFGAQYPQVRRLRADT